MSGASTVEAAVRASYAWARRVPDAGACVALHLGDEASALAWGTGAEPDGVAVLPLGLHTLADRYFPGGRLSEMAIEAAIAEVEDIVMPWHGQLPPGARLVSGDAAIAELAAWAGMRGDGPWQFGTESVEHLFNRWVALAQGRPASQDALPTTGAFSATLLVLREWLHHLGFEGITVMAGPPQASSAAGPKNS